MEFSFLYLIITFLTVCTCIYRTSAISCYQCADTHDGTTSCMRRTKHLLAQRELHERKGEPIKNLSNMKNCTHYRDSRGEYIYQFCKIERIMAHGVLTAYIRDCTDMRSFGLEIEKLTLVRSDNQTICGYSQRHVANVCISVCDSDFCNGPTLAATSVRALPVLGLVLTILTKLLL